METPIYIYRERERDKVTLSIVTLHVLYHIVRLGAQYDSVSSALLLRLASPSLGSQEMLRFQ